MGLKKRKKRSKEAIVTPAVGIAEFLSSPKPHQQICKKCKSRPYNQQFRAQGRRGDVLRALELHEQIDHQ
jgi:hypothetical protein